MNNPVFNKLYQGQDLTFDETFATFKAIFNGDMDEINLSSLLTALKIKGEKDHEIAGAAMAMLAACEPFDRPEGDVGEIVGTGGDCTNTFNISTIAGIICSCLGLRIAKHGNRAVSSQTGASDVLDRLHYDINAPMERSAAALAEEGFCFLFAQKYHKAMRFAGPVRKALGTRTIFNLLGPLTNPAHANYELMGVYDKDLLPIMAATSKLTGNNRTMCVNGNGMDEIAPFGLTYVSELKDDGSIINYTLTKEDFGITEEFTQADLLGGDSETNSRIAMDVLAGNCTRAQRAAVGVNAGALLYLGGAAKNIREGYEMAVATIDSGVAKNKFKRICQVIAG